MNRKLWNWLMYPARMAGYSGLRRVMRKIGILR